MSDYLTVAEAAKAIDRTPQTVRQLANSGRLAAIRTGAGTRFFQREAIEAYLRERDRLDALRKELRNQLHSHEAAPPPG